MTFVLLLVLLLLGFICYVACRVREHRHPKDRTYPLVLIWLSVGFFAAACVLTLTGGLL